MIRSLSKTMMVITVLAFFAVLYVRGHVTLLGLSYAIDAKAEKVNALTEEFRTVKYDVDQMKAPLTLERRMKELSLELQYPTEVHTLVVPLHPTSAALHAVAPGTITDRMWNFLGQFVEIAQAKDADS